MKLDSSEYETGSAYYDSPYPDQNIDRGFAYIHLDHDGNIAYANQYILVLIGKSWDETIGSKPWRLSSFFQDTDIENLLHYAIAEGRPLSRTIERYKIRGTDYTLDIHIQPVIQGADILFNISTPNQASQDKETSLQMGSWFTALVHANIIGVKRTRQNVIIDANSVFLDMIGYTEDELKAGELNSRRITPVEYHQADRQSIKDLSNKGYSAPYEKEYYHKNGNRVPVIIGAALISSDPVEWVSYIIDLTERKRIEMELSRLYERERAIAEHLQISLLTPPSPDAYPNLELNTLYQAAWDDAQVGGDFFDVWLCAPGKIALVVGDVSGKGLAAASRTAEVKYTLRAYLCESDSASLVMNRINNFITVHSSKSDGDFNTFICLALAILDLNTWQVDYAGCGIDGTLIMHTDGTYTHLYTEGLPLGCVANNNYSSIQSTIAAGDILVTATDGITEARHKSDFLGIEGIANIINKIGIDQHLPDMSATLYQETQTFTGGKLTDDVCLLLARRTQ